MGVQMEMERVPHDGECLSSQRLRRSWSEEQREPSSPDDSQAGNRASLGLTVSEATANFVIGLVGAGVLILPKNLADTGGLTGMCLLALGFLCVTECAVQLNEAISKAELIAGKGRIKSYEDLAGEAFGIPGKVFLLLLKNVYWLGVLIVYELFVIESFQNLFPFDRHQVRWFIAYPIFILGAMVKDLKTLTPVQPVIIATAFLPCGTFALGSICELLRPGFSFETPMFNGVYYDWGTTMAVSLFSCGGVVSMTPAVRSQMAEPEKCSSAIRLGMVIVFWIYSSVMCSVYAAYGTYMDADLLELLGADCQPVQCVLAKTTAIGVSVKLCFTVPSLMYLVTSVFESSGQRRICKPMSYQNIAFRIMLMTTLHCIGMVAPFVHEIIGLLSASFGLVIALLFPLATCYAMKRRLARSPAAQHASAGGLQVRDCIVHSLVIVIGLCVAYFGVTGAWAKLRLKMHSGDVE